MEQNLLQFNIAILLEHYLNYLKNLLNICFVFKEVQAMRECIDNAFWYRSMPGGLFTGGSILQEHIHTSLQGYILHYRRTYLTSLHEYILY